MSEGVWLSVSFDDAYNGAAAHYFIIFWVPSETGAF